MNNTSATGLPYSPRLQTGPTHVKPAASGSEKDARNVSKDAFGDAVDAAGGNGAPAKEKNSLGRKQSGENGSDNPSLPADKADAGAGNSDADLVQKLNRLRSDSQSVHPHGAAEGSGLSPEDAPAQPRATDTGSPDMPDVKQLAQTQQKTPTVPGPDQMPTEGSAHSTGDSTEQHVTALPNTTRSSTTQPGTTILDTQTSDRRSQRQPVQSDDNRQIQSVMENGRSSRVAPAFIGQAHTRNSAAPLVMPGQSNTGEILDRSVFARGDGASRALDVFKSARNQGAAGEMGQDQPGSEDPKKSGQISMTDKLSVVEARQYPAVSATQSSAAAVVGAISDNQAWSSALRRSEAVAATTLNLASKPVNTLKIQLNPAELGVVNATLRLSGEQLTVELKVETLEAYRQLSDSQQTILKSLKAQGFAVEQLSIQQATVDRAQAPTGAAQGFAQSSGNASSQSGGGNSPGAGEGNNGHQQNGKQGAIDPDNSQSVDPQPNRSGAAGSVYL